MKTEKLLALQNNHTILLEAMKHELKETSYP